ncbi:2-polyprenyl-3-methyl-6-methoxy-1,4-benzoquinone monooxygenase [Candidatus Berkiella aquae]|uniref:3-demethoxyubiquinol 3-hydroxylase n=1 Tax=Candidatus Berkiella aquae TaxID=295108 RepID=A0A0Q9YN94_9GAMM|nr:2-polyprenyl-3-methyl-6-methoxy-1,4-benzoquinone monooxygenase [Candidatus Berkiella aquae]MCS5712530.1 2-polyprenyl-3-methyl-6-methoxy-1,4-benzoquinone monooxygenase [Candidatus Berkiella aquae]
MRQYSLSDTFLNGVLQCIRTIHQTPAKGSRPNPAAILAEPSLSLDELKLSASLMRVNHTGEVCAQALYLGQEFATNNANLKTLFATAASEEVDHLHWCETRLNELGSHTSYLNPLWFTGSLFIGTCAGLFSNRFSLGFLAETENQVFAHLASHLEKLPPHDTKSRAIVEKMQADEAAHAATAMHHGGIELPLPIKTMMRMMAKMMTTIAAKL